MPFFLNRVENDLLTVDIARLERETKNLEEEKRLISNRIKELEKEKEQYITQKAALNIDSQILLLNRDVDRETEKKNSKSDASQMYEKYCKQLGIDIPVDRTTFNLNFERVEELSQSLPIKRELLSEEKAYLKIEQDTSHKNINKIQGQITSLLERRNRIPEDLINARKRLADILEMAEDELPFVGELIKVTSTEQKWEDAIERLLHNFSMQLLVPQEHIKAANHFIYNNDMQTKLVYQKIERKPWQALRWNRNPDDLVNKLEFKESNYKDWVEAILIERFNYHCTDDLDVFYGSQKAITSNGLIRNINRHEKDDRPGRWNKGKYRLGWDNRETIKYLQQEKNKEEEKHESISRKIKEITPQIDAVNDTINVVNNIFRYNLFDEIDWQRHAQKIATLNSEIEKLKSSSDTYAFILENIKQVEGLLHSDNKKRDSLIRKIGIVEKECNDKNLRLLQLKHDELTDIGQNAVNLFLEEEGIGTSMYENLLQFESIIKQIAVRLKTKQKIATDSVNRLEKEIIKDIAAFTNPEEKIITEFPNWSGDVMNINTDLSSLDDIEELYRTIQTKRLVEHKRRFRDYMDKSMLDALTSYRAWLENELDKIKDMIDELNIPLKKITFNRNPDTYLQLEYRPVRGENEINIFKAQLGDAIPSTLDFAMQQDDSYRQQVFQKIKDLITELQKEETWRRKVSDVRNWITFGAREYSIAENKPEQYHDNTASYSGGQKAQFTYAILGAAIAHQFGIFQQGRQHKSLRFITVDEAFSKLDPEKSRFLMEFCEQLNLQILVVTPLDKINIAEPYIHAVHFVEIKNKKNSVLYNLTMEQYYEKKETFKQLAEEIE